MRIMNYKTAIEEIGIDKINQFVSKVIENRSMQPYKSSRAFAAGVECGMTALIDCLVSEKFSINKRKKFIHYAKKVTLIRHNNAIRKRMRNRAIKSD